ncbi:MAG: DUF6152 family protein [Steroidobacteraceae bacterium]
MHAAKWRAPMAPLAALAAMTAVAGMAVMAARPAYAHHSFAMFDHKHQVKLNGTVQYFQWTNPHVYIRLVANDAQGHAKSYTIECANPGLLDRAGWKWNMIKVGDKVTAIIAPLRTGEPGGLLKQITLPNGRSYDNGPAAGRANIQ